MGLPAGAWDSNGETCYINADQIVAVYVHHDQPR